MSAAELTILRDKVLYLFICTSLPIEEALERVNRIHTSGISSDWIVCPAGFKGDDQAEDGANGVACQDHPETHKHWILSC